MATDRERFSPSELAVVLSHYDLGLVESAREYARGSRHSPKLLLQTAAGPFLLKRRAEGRGHPERITFTHELFSQLRDRKFPIPQIVLTRDTQNSHVMHEG